VAVATPALPHSEFLGQLRYNLPALGLRGKPQRLDQRCFDNAIQLRGRSAGPRAQRTRCGCTLRVEVAVNINAVGRWLEFRRSWPLFAIASALAACGESSRASTAGRAGTGGTRTAGGIGGMNGGAPSVAGRGAASAAAAGGGSAGSARAAGAGGGGTSGSAGSAGAGQEGGAMGGSDATAGTSGQSQAGAAQGGAAQGGAAQGGASQGGAAGTNECLVGAPAQTCDAMPLQYHPPFVVVDFTNYASDGTWSGSTMPEITGRTTLSHSAGAPDLMLEAAAGSLHVTGTLPSMSKAGFTFSFDSCVVAGPYLGFTIPVDGDLQGATLTVAVQTNADYPIDALAGKGACSFQTCTTRWEECQAPSAEIAVPTMAYQAWSVFTGGMPEDSVSQSSPELLGVEFEVTCAKNAACIVDLTIGKISMFSV
jgi:hypothetical protein